MSDEQDVQAVERLHEVYGNLQRELAKVVVGQQDVIEQLLVALFGGGHCLLVGVPGLAKTLLVRTLADALSLEFNRVQFTPDLMPADITGTEVIQEDRSSGERSFRFLPGPVFANVVLADEVNRTPPKTQAALLEAMQEQQVTVGGQRHQLPQPFFVLATQNPIEQEGTYPLPEAQLDRFMFEVLVDYPERHNQEAVSVTDGSVYDNGHLVVPLGVVFGCQLGASTDNVLYRLICLFAQSASTILDGVIDAGLNGSCIQCLFLCRHYQ
ncbi:MAG: AAA family ATPase, partial [Planctomycetota bacterium]